MANIDDAIALYATGVSLKKCSEQTGVSIRTIQQTAIASGIIRRRKEWPTASPAQIAEIVSRYKGGEALQPIGDSFALPPTAIARIVKQNGVSLRSRKDVWAIMSPDKRANQVAAAHNSVRGKKRTEEELGKRAATRQIVGQSTSESEQAIATSLTASGLSIQPQLAFGKYNLDIAIHSPPVAVELFGGRWHTNGRHAERFFDRSKQILGTMALAIIWSVRDHTADESSIAKAMVTFCNFLRSQESTAGWYYVILGDAKLAPASETYFNDDAIVSSLGARRYRPNR